jgi:acyl-lipid omega-6 desaturase (Delta-12 desaturase)
LCSCLSRLFAASIGVWLFYVQHQFEDTFWADDEGWNFHEAALHGSSHYDLPSVLRWFTANIGVHHVHHLCSRIPYYRLPRVLRDHPQLAAVGRLTLFESLRCVRMVLWDERQRRLIAFGEIGSVCCPRAGEAAPIGSPSSKNCVNTASSKVPRAFGREAEIHITGRWR